MLVIGGDYCVFIEGFFETLLERNHRPRRDIHRVIYYSLFGIDVSRNANTYFGYFRRYNLLNRVFEMLQRLFKCRVRRERRNGDFMNNLIVFNESEVDSRFPDVDSKKHCLCGFRLVPQIQQKLL